MQKASGKALNSAQSPPTGHRPNRRNLAWGIAGGWILVDQATKIWAQEALTGRDPVPVVGQLLEFRLVYNSGAAFSMGAGNTWIFTILATLVVSYLLWHTRSIDHRGWAVALGLLIGGAGGNLIDRLTREPGFGRGHVVDFIALPNFPVFNVADIGIFCAAVLIGLLVLRGENDEQPIDQTPDGEVNHS
ncbi:MAG: signal peptidase II [Ornithinimicrobium sp.]